MANVILEHTSKWFIAIQSIIWMDLFSKVSEGWQYVLFPMISTDIRSFYANDKFLESEWSIDTQNNSMTHFRQVSDRSQDAWFLAILHRSKQFVTC